MPFKRMTCILTFSLILILLPTNIKATRARAAFLIYRDSYINFVTWVIFQVVAAKLYEILALRAYRLPYQAGNYEPGTTN